MDDAAHARDAGAIERKPHLRLFGLTIGIEAQSALEPANASVERDVDEAGRDLRKRNRIVGTGLETLFHDPFVEDEQVDIDRAWLEPARAAGAADR